MGIVWRSVIDEMPKCDMTPDSLGVAIEVKPKFKFHDKDPGESQCYYGRRQSDKPNFYKYGAVINGVTHWRYVQGPKP